MCKKWLIVIFVTTCAALATAQIPKANVYFGYAYAKTDLAAGQSANLNGWDGQLEGSVFPFISVVADVGGYYGSTNLVPLGCIPAAGFSCSANGNVYTFLVGPRASFSVGKFRPFAHVLFGGGHTSVSTTGFSTSDTSFSDLIGGGLDYKLIPAVAWRLQGDYLQTRFYGGNQNNARFTTGIVLRF
jgi:hypothetical protein